jgi:hypothetical protein
MCLKREHTVDMLNPTELDGSLISLFVLHSSPKAFSDSDPYTLF